MTVLQGFVLGLMQGVAEFLPISSSGHLAVVQHVFGLDEIPLLFDVLLHLATLLAVIIYFRKIICRLCMILFRAIGQKTKPISLAPISDEKIATLAPTEQAGRQTIIMIIITTLITGIIGVATSKLIKSFTLTQVCIGFLVTAGLLVTASVVDKIRYRHRAARHAVSDDCQLTGIAWWQAVVIGFAQGVGTLPGVSRSGSTIAGALFTGVDRRTAGDYSFIVSIPAILGAFLLEAKDLGALAGSVGLLPLFVGCLAAFVSGYLALAWLMRIIRRGHLEWFALYLVPLGILGLIFF